MSNVSPGAGDLTTLAAAYGYLRLTAGSDDVALQLAITAVSQRIAAWCSRSFVPTDHDELYDGTGNPRLILRNFPIISIATVEVDGLAIAPRSVPHGSGYGSDRRRTLDVYGRTFPRGRHNVRVVYRAGFDPIPADLQFACLEWLKTGYLSQDRPADLIARRAADHEERYASTGSVVTIGGKSVPMPAGIYAVLSQYQDNVPA